LITVSEATRTAESYIQDMERACGFPLMLLKEQTIERNFGWVFFYTLAASLGPTGHDALAGNAPFIIDKRDGSLHETGTAHPVEYYLDNYERTGATHLE
jgi:immunity protein 35 of polymorphic toxin system